MRWWTAAGWTLFAVSSLGLLLTGHGSVPVAGEGAIGVSVLGSAVTAAAALLLIRLVPPALDGGFPRLDRTRLLRQTWLLAGLAGLTPLAFGLLVALDLDRSLGLLIKLLMFFLAPLAGLALSGGIRLPGPGPRRCGAGWARCPRSWATCGCSTVRSGGPRTVWRSARWERWW